MTSTATEVKARLEEAACVLAPFKSYIDHMAQWMFKAVYETKVPLIRYGRRKRHFRRVFPGHVSALRVTFDGVGVSRRSREVSRARREKV